MSTGAEATVMSTMASERVKMVDMHPKEPLVIAALYSGYVYLHNYVTNTLIRAFDTATGLPVRCARFLPKIQSFVCGCDDANLRVYNFNTMERTKMFQAHEDFIRGIAVHDHLSLVLTCADDMTIRQWDPSKGWALQMTYEGHQHFCMAVAFNPKDEAMFASASMDGTIKVWHIGNPVPNYQLEGHEEGVNCIDFCPRGDKPYLLSGSDDRTARLWDYQTKSLLHTFQFHEGNVSGVFFHPDLPLIFTISESDSIAAFSAETFRLLYSCPHTDLGRGWSLSAKRFSNVLVAGFDKGIRTYKVGLDRPISSMDSSGRVMLAIGNEIVRMDIKLAGSDAADGEVLSVMTKDLGSIEVSPRALLHAPNGQFVCVVGENDFTIISPLSLRSKSYGQCTAFVWGPENGSYAILEGSTTLKVYKGFKDLKSLQLPTVSDRLFGGALIAVRTRQSVLFYDWDTLDFIVQIDESLNFLEWCPTQEMVALVTDNRVFLLKFTRDADGRLTSFEEEGQLEELVREATWIGDLFVYIDKEHRLNYYIDGDVINVAALQRNQYLLGYVRKENRLFCIDKEKNITSYLLPMPVIDYMVAIVRKDAEAAKKLRPNPDTALRDKLSRFAESRGLLSEAFEITTDKERQFELAVRQKDLERAYEIAQSINQNTLWKQLGDLSMKQGDFDIACEALEKCKDWQGLLLLWISLNDMQAIAKLGDVCLESGHANVAFTCFHLTQNHEKCVELLQKTGKPGEAAFYARTYCPKYIADAVAQWKGAVAAIPRVREALADPVAYPNLFPHQKDEGLAGRGAPSGFHPSPDAAATSSDSSTKAFDADAPSDE